MENREIRRWSGKIILMKKSGKFMKNYESRRKVRENEIVVANVSESVDIAHFIPILCQKKKSYQFILCYTADKSGKIF